jgi:hypothetical protein
MEAGIFSSFLTRVLTASSNDGRGCGMSTRPGFYSGRGATTTDLSSEKLEILYKAIQYNVNDKAAQAFAQMVADIPCLTATDFLLSLARLEGRGWIWDAGMLGDEHGVYASGVAEGWGTVGEALGGRDADHTVIIRSTFLRAHGIRDPRVGKGQKYDAYGYLSDSYRYENEQ